MLTNSWIVVSKATGCAVVETWNPHLAALVNRDKYTVLTAYDYLCQLNRKLKRENVDGGE